MMATGEERGKLIAEKPNQIMRLEERFYKVNSQSGHGMYNVTKRKTSGWLCDCPDFVSKCSKASFSNISAFGFLASAAWTILPQS